MARLAFCGLGQMGSPLAGRLLEAGHELTVWNRTPARAEPLVGQGARPAGSPAEAARHAEAVLTMLATPDALEAVAFGPDGLAEAMGPGHTLIDMSTVGPRVVRAVAERLGAVEVLDAPVLGSVSRATDGTLDIFVGGSAEAFERWRPVLACLGSARHVGPLGAGAAMKLVTNSTLGALMTALAEALALADAMGLEQADVLDVLAGSPIGATVKSKRDKIESGSYDPNFKLSLATKDVGLVVDAAVDAGIALRLAPAYLEWFRDAAEAGLGDRDYSAVVAHVRGALAGGQGPLGGR